MAYSTVLLDLDHTLFDTHASEAAAFATTMATIGIDTPAAVFPRYDAINQALWAGVERGELGPNDVKTRRFAELLADLGRAGDATELAEVFAAGLGCHGELYRGARAVLDELRCVANLALLTNGLSDVQRARLARLELTEHFDAIVISAEVGVSKPDPAIFSLVFDELAAVLGTSVDRSTALMVGDSLSSDIAGGNAFGIDTCWFNPGDRPGSQTLVATHQIAALEELPLLLS